jgi:hypothetical protein
MYDDAFNPDSMGQRLYVFVRILVRGYYFFDLVLKFEYFGSIRWQG